MNRFTEKRAITMKCHSCGAEAFDTGRAFCSECGAKFQTSDDVRRNGEIEKTNREIEKIILTTAPALDNYIIVDTIEIVTAECAYGVNVIRDFFSGMTDIFGGRSHSTQKVLRDARKSCLLELKKEAYNTGANAVIAVDLDYSELSGQGKSMLFLVASGTAVVVEKQQ